MSASSDWQFRGQFGQMNTAHLIPIRTSSPLLLWKERGWCAAQVQVSQMYVEPKMVEHLNEDHSDENSREVDVKNAHVRFSFHRLLFLESLNRERLTYFWQRTDPAQIQKWRRHFRRLSGMWDVFWVPARLRSAAYGFQDALAAPSLKRDTHLHRESRADYVGHQENELRSPPWEWGFCSTRNAVSAFRQLNAKLRPMCIGRAVAN